MTPDPMGVHPDAQQDAQQIVQIMDAKLGPAFELIGKEFASVKQDVEDLKDTVYKLVTSFSDAVTGYKRNGLTDKIKGSYGADLDTLAPVYSDFAGSDLTQDLIDAIMSGEGDPDEIARTAIDGLKAKFGKYLGQPAQASVEITTEAPEGMTEPSADGEVAPAPEEETKPLKASDQLMQQIRALRAGKTA